jgi:hypothetical protein
MVLGLIAAYFIGRSSRKAPVVIIENNETEEYLLSGDQDPRSFEELLIALQKRRTTKDTP